MSNQVQTQNNERFNIVLDKMVAKGISTFPKGVEAERLKINALMCIAQDNNLSDASKRYPAKIAQAVYNFVALGLDMLNRECYIIPFIKGKGTQNESIDLTIIKDYKGEIKLARKYSVDPIREIFARVVYENDSYHFDEFGRFIHNFDPFSTERGQKKGAYCTVIYENGVHQTEFVNVEEINKVKGVSRSSSYDSSPWKKWEDEMWRKTAIRKAMKNISLDFGSSETLKAYQESDNDVEMTNGARSNNDVVIEQHDPLDTVIDSEATEINIDDV